MNLLSNIRKTLDSIESEILLSASLKHERRKIREPRRQEIIRSFVPTEQQVADTKKFFKENLGCSICLDWHREYAAFTGNYCVDYFPELFYIPVCQGLLNDRSFARAFDDKRFSICLTSAGLKMPRRLFECSNGCLVDCEGTGLSIGELAARLCQSAFFIKKTVNTNSGKGCRKVGVSELDYEETAKLLRSFLPDFCIEEVLKPSEALRRLHPESINTFRVETQFVDGEAFCSPLLLRIGRGKSAVDNAHAGGIFVGVDECTESLLPWAYTEFLERFDRHPDTQVIFSSYPIKGIKKIIDAALRVQRTLALLPFLDLDFTLDEDDEPVLIELNTLDGSPWMSQMANGRPIFGHNTARILQMVGSRLGWR